MATKKKKETVKELNQLFQNSQVLIFTDYRGLKVSDITNLRRQFREKGVEYHVAKNTLSLLAANRSGMETMSPMLDGPTAIAFVNDDIPGAAKVLADFMRTNKVIQIRGGLMGKTVITADQVGDLTKILSREQYISQLLGSMKAPVQNFVSTLNAPLQGFVNVLNARLNQVKEGGDTAVDTAPTTATATVPDVTSEVAADAAPETAADAAPAPVETAPAVDADAPADAAPADAAPDETEA